MSKRTDPPITRFWAKVEKRSDGCWIWTGFRSGAPSNEYGGFRVNKKLHRAHRWAYETFMGPIPEGLQLDHLCRNRLCVNPDHLEPVTHQENLRRGNGWSGRNARRTHCPKGHPYSGSNLYYDNGSRKCRVCVRERNRRAKERRRRQML